MVKVKTDMTGWKMWEHGVSDSRLMVIQQVDDYVDNNGQNADVRPNQLFAMVVFHLPVSLQIIKRSDIFYYSTCLSVIRFYCDAAFTDFYILSDTIFNLCHTNQPSFLCNLFPFNMIIFSMCFSWYYKYFSFIISKHYVIQMWSCQNLLSNSFNFSSTMLNFVLFKYIF